MSFAVGAARSTVPHRWIQLDYRFSGSLTIGSSVDDLWVDLALVFKY